MPRLVAFNVFLNPHCSYTLPQVLSSIRHLPRLFAVGVVNWQPNPELVSATLSVALTETALYAL